MSGSEAGGAATGTVTGELEAGVEPYLRDFEAVRRLPFSDLRRRALDHFVETGFPTARDEEWRFTNVAPIVKAEWAAPAAPAVDAAEIAAHRYDDCANLVLVDGQAVPGLWDELPAGVSCRRLGEIEGAVPLGELVDLGGNPFTALNTALFRDALVLEIEERAQVDRALHVLHLVGASGRPGASYPRLFLWARAGSESTVIETYTSHAASGRGEPTATFNCAVTECEVERNAVLNHFKVQKESLQAYHVATFQIHMERDAVFSSHNIAHGGALVRNDVNAVLDGSGVDCTLNGLYVLSGSQLVDNHMRVEHKKPNSYSHELYKGVLDGRSRAVFSGRIFVHEGASGTDAKQSNRNLLLSDQAMVNSNPQLEIFNDDVRCTHGSTTGELEEEAIFYLRSRGIPREAAESLLTYAFASEFVELVEQDQLRRDLKQFLFSRLPGGERVRQAVE